MINDNVFPLYVSHLAQPLLECRNASCDGGRFRAS
jgi:hypothetical protein